MWVIRKADTFEMKKRESSGIRGQEEAGFRTHADSEGLVGVQEQINAGLLLGTPDITLPSKLTPKIWSIVSSHPPERRIFNTPYQWLSYAFGSVNGACLFWAEKPDTT